MCLPLRCMDRALRFVRAVFDVRDVLLNLPHNRISWAKYELSGGVGAALLHFRLQPHNALAGTDPPPAVWVVQTSGRFIGGGGADKSKPTRKRRSEKKVLTSRIVP